MRPWVLWAVLLLSPVVVWGQACTHYASPTGSGSTCTLGSPCLINSFWSIASLPGKVLCLNDGTYTGANSLITPPAGIAGTSGNPITIRALNEGQVLIDAQNSASFAVWLSSSNGNNWFVIDGINAANGIEAVYALAGTDNIAQRTLGWNGTSGAESYVYTITGDRSRAVDCGGWGMNVRKVFNGSQAGDVDTAGFKRCWGEWNDHPQGSSNPNNTLQIGYNTTDQLFENMVMTWDTLGQTGETEGVVGAFTNNTASDPDIGGTRLLGSILYVRPGSTYSAPAVMQSGFTTNLAVVDTVLFVAPGYTSIYPGYFLGCTTPACSGNTCTNCLAVHAGTPLQNDSGSGWTFPSLHQGNGLAAATGGTSAFALLPGICYRYESGTITSTPLWPWPMDARISAARIAGGFRDVTVTTEVESILGTIPAACRSDGGGPTFLSEVTGLDVTGNATIAFLGEVTGLDLTAGSTAGTLGEVTGLDLTGNASITFLGEVTGLTLTP